jgi:outer membrane protein OmpA-like peptidoglycan-associated protein
MRARIAAAVVILCALSATTLPAQVPGTLEIGAFGRFTRFDRSLGLDNGFGGGGWLGVFVAPGLAIEGAGGYLPTTGPFISDGTLIPLHARLVYARSVAGPLALLVGGGYVHNVYGRTANVSDDGVSGLFGLRLGGPALAARVEAVEDFIPSPRNQSAGVANNWNFTIQAGLTAYLGRSRPKDSDGDGIVDRLDACSATPPREAVDDRGCALPRDSDGDGVVDRLDTCAATPARDQVDARGCSLPKDSDGDRVTDDLDRCPNSSPGEAVDAAGCPKDTDGDGVIDSADKCAVTAPGEKVDATGCPPTPPLDSDGDGVVDSSDKCSGTPAGERVDAIGCPALFVGASRTLVLEGATFETGRVTLTAQARGALDRVAVGLKGNPGLRVEVAGYTDNRGTTGANLRLSQARADAVRGYLIERGVPPEQVVARGLGADDPVDTNATAVGRSRNRRVELHRLD